MKLAKPAIYTNRHLKLQLKQADQLFSFTSEEEKQLYLKNIIGAEDEYQSFYFDKLRNGNGGQPYSIALQKRNQILILFITVKANDLCQ